MKDILYEKPNSPGYLNIVEETEEHFGVWISHSLWLKPLHIKTGDEDFIDKDIKDLIDKWRIQAKDYQDFDGYYIKHANEEFIYKDKFYFLHHEAINLTPENMDKFFKIIEDDLRAIGCLFYLYHGVLD